MKWVQASERLPGKEGIYKVKRMYSEGIETGEFSCGAFTNYDGYRVTEWLDESASSSNEDYVASNSNTDDTSLASHSCTDGGSIEQKFKTIKDRKRQLKEQFEKSLPPKNIRAWMKEKTEKTFEINNGNLDKQSFHLGMNAMWNYCYSHKLLNKEQNVQVSDTTTDAHSGVADNKNPLPTEGKGD